MAEHETSKKSSDYLITGAGHRVSEFRKYTREELVKFVR